MVIITALLKYSIDFLNNEIYHHSMNKRLLETKENQEEIFNKISSLLSGLSSPVRIRLLHFLSQSPLSVEVLSEKIGQTVANTSMHLRKMHAANIVEVSVVGQRRLYRLHPATFDFWEKMQDYFQLIYPGMDLKTNQTYGDLNFDDTKLLLTLIKSHQALIIDVRPSDEARSFDFKAEFYQQIPGPELLKKTLPKNKKLFIFCRGRFCALSADTVYQLRTKGFDAFRLPYSWLELQKILKGVKV